tara:strand:- start:1027 stop:2016 length:990 start_codon:yes stop_codon:yes gene_type:complete
MKKILPKLSKATELNDVHSCLEENYNILSIDWFLILSKWMFNSYTVFKDHEKYLILILLVKKTFDYYSANFIKLNWSQFFDLKQIELGKFSIIHVAKELKISKETTRRKIEELEKNNIIKKNKSGVVVQTEFYSKNFIKDHEVFRKLICAFISKFSLSLVEEKIVKEKVKPELIEKAVNQNFSYAWKVFFEMMIPILVDLKELFKDLETWHVWGTCVVNQNYETQKYLKFKNFEYKNRKEFFNSYSKGIKKVGINAMSISNITGIPRATVIRKLDLLIKKKYLFVDNKKLYFPNIQINESQLLYKQNNLNIKRLSIFVNKLLNLTIASK